MSFKNCLGQLSERRSIACDESVMSIWWTYDEHVMHGPPGQPRPPSTAVGRQARPRPEFPCKAQAGAKIRQSQRQLFQIHNISYYIIISWYPYHMPSRDAQQRKHQISASTPFAAKPRTFNVAAVASLLARVSIPSLMLFLGLAKIYGLCFWEWIDMDCLFDLVCMDLYGSVWCLTRTLWTNSETPGATNPKIRNCPNMSLQFLPKLWRLRLSMLVILASLLLIQVQSRPGCDTLWVSLGIPSASVEGLWRVMKGWNAGWATLNTSCYSAPFCSGSTLHTWNRLLFKMCPESKRRFCRFWWRRVF